MFVFGGSVDAGGSGRGLGYFNNDIGVLNLCEDADFEWSKPTLENKNLETGVIAKRY